MTITNEHYNSRFSLCRLAVKQNVNQSRSRKEREVQKEREKNAELVKQL